MTPSQQKLAQVDLQKQQSELEAREKAVADKEEYLTTVVAETESALSVVEAKVDVRGKELSDLEYAVGTIKARLKTSETIEEQTKAKHKESHNKAERELSTVTGKVTSAKSELAQAGARLDTINAEMGDRLAYQDTQEELIQQSLRDGNDRLLSLRDDITQTGLAKEELLREIMKIRQSTNEAQTEYDNTMERLSILADQYNLAVDKYKASLSELRSEIAKASEELKAINAEADQKLVILKAKETEVMANRKVIAEERQELAMQQRRVQSAQSLYGE